MALKNAQFLMKFWVDVTMKNRSIRMFVWGSNIVTVFSLFLGECVSVSDSLEGLENFFRHALGYNLNALFHFLLQAET